ncbi:MAG: hypothetical protein KA436_03075 [Oligoflexales bacterium]|nr:hypothetical protein [Oligoflexales bacterium]
MSTKELAPKNWRSIQSIKDAVHLCDEAVLISWAHVTKLKKVLTKDEQTYLLCYLVKKFNEKIKDRLFCEITIESLLVFLSKCINKEVISELVPILFKEQQIVLPIKTILEISLTANLSEKPHSDELRETAVKLICEIGKYAFDLNKTHEDKNSKKELAEVLSHIQTYLLSVANQNSPTLRLCLFHYFGYTNIHRESYEAFDKIMSRFGFTVLDSVFLMLFKKKTELPARAFLLENLVFVLKLEGENQLVFHETLRHYLLKKPEQFLMFLQIFNEKIIGSPELSSDIKRPYLQHLAALFKVASEVHHQDIGSQILQFILKVKDPYQKDIFSKILQDQDIMDEFKYMLESTLNDPDLELSIPTFLQKNKLLKKIPAALNPLKFGILSQIEALS